MKSWDERLFSLMQRHSGRTICLLLLAALAVAPFIRPTFDNSLEGWIDINSTDYRDYRHLINTFGDDQNILLVFSRQDISDNKIPAYLALIDSIQDMPGVSAVYEPLQRFLGVTEFDPVIDDTLVDSLQQSLAGHADDIRSVLISQDVRLLGLLILVDHDQTVQQALILSQLEQGFQALGIPYQIGGTVYFSAVLNRALPRDMAIVISLLIMLALIALLFYFKNVRLVFSIFAGISLSLVFTLAFAGAMGMNMTLLSLIIFPLVFCVSITPAIHLFSRRQAGNWQAEKAFQHVRKPAFIAMLTTAIGCASFILAPQSIIARMGTILPMAVVCSFLCILFFTPTLFVWLSGAHTIRLPVHKPVAFYNYRRQRWISWLLILAAVLSASFLNHIKTNPDAFYFFKQDSDFVQSYRLIENQLTGLVAIELIVRAEDRHRLTETPHRPDIEALLTHFRQLPDITHVVSVFAPLHVLSLDALPDDLRRSMLNTEATEARITLRFKNSDGFDYRETVSQIRQIFEQHAIPNVSMRLTGLVPLILEAQDALLKVQSQVFGFSLMILTGLIALIFRSLKIVLCAITANLIPLLITAGCMVLFDMTINSFNIFVAAVMLGVIVDDTVHLLYAYRCYGSIQKALNDVHTALWITTITVLSAFATLMLSDFVPLIQFGLLSVVAIINAYLCDVYLLPYLMTGVQRRHERTTR